MESEGTGALTRMARSKLELEEKIDDRRKVRPAAHTSPLSLHSSKLSCFEYYVNDECDRKGWTMEGFRGVGGKNEVLQE